MATDHPTWLVEVRKVAPSGTVLLAVQLRDGETRELRVPDRRKRWTQIIKAMALLDWVRIEVFQILGKRRELAGVVESETAPADEIEDLVPSKSSELLSILIKAQDMALSRYERIVGSVLDRQVALVDTVIRSVNATADIYAHALGVARQSADQGGEDKRSGAERLMESLAPQLMAQVVSGAKRPAPAPNGKPPNGQ